MATISDEAIAAVAYQAGFTDTELLAKFVAIALAESSGNPRAHNNVNKGHFGLWQIAGVHEALMKKYGGTDKAYDPAINAKMAYEVYKGQGLGAWETYTNGMYLPFLPRGRAAAKKIKAAALKDPTLTGIDIVTGGAISDVGDTIDNTLESASKIVDFFTSKANWVRVGMWVAAWVLIFLAFKRMFGSQVFSGAVKVASKVVLKGGGKAIKKAL